MGELAEKFASIAGPTKRADFDTVVTLTDEPLRLVDKTRAASSEVSLIGEFVERDAIRIHQLRENTILRGAILQRMLASCCSHSFRLLR